MNDSDELYGLMAEFDTPEQLVEATRRTRQAGYQRIDAYSPFPIEELPALLGPRKTWIRLAVLIGGLVGGIGGYMLQYFTMAMSYPINVGGRPYNSWQAFVPVTFELTILGASLVALISMLAFNGLPLPYHPVFNVAAFSRATRDRFFLLIQADDPRFERAATERFLQGLGPLEVADVPA